MSKSNYRELIVWQKSRTLIADVYRATRSFPTEERFGLSAQMRRAAISIACNLAESQSWRSKRDVTNFLQIARGSALELETQLLIASDLELMESRAAEEVTERLLEIERMLNGLIRYVRGGQ